MEVVDTRRRQPSTRAPLNVLISDETAAKENFRLRTANLQFIVASEELPSDNPWMSVSFAQDIVPLFTGRDITCMARFGVGLNDYDYMSDPTGNDTFVDHTNARDVYAHLTGTKTPRMPMGGPYWTDAQLQLFDQWMTDGFLA
jgi:hypothetical protein